MNYDYDKIYDEFKESFKEEANSLISADKIRQVLKDEKRIFSSAKKHNVSIKSFAGNNLVRYTKDTLRRCQPLSFIYFILSFFTEFFYCMLLWCAVKCCILYFIGNKNAFSETIPLTAAPIFFAASLICHAITQYHTKYKLLRNTDNIKHSISIFNIISYIISAVVITAVFLLLYYNLDSPSYENRNIFYENFFNITLFNIFLYAVAFLFLSGIHNVIYSSHIVSFITIGTMVFLRHTDQTDKSINHYMALRLANFVSIRHITIEDYKKSDKHIKEFNSLMRSSLKSYRLYSSFGLFIAIVLDVTCIIQLFKALEIGFIIFTFVSLIITFILFITILSCNGALKFINGIE